MKISSSRDVADYIQNRPLTETASSFNSPASRKKDARPVEEAARVSLSRKSKEILRAWELIGTLPDVRKEKIGPIKARLSDGAYRIHFDDTTEKMLRDFNVEWKR